MVCVEKRESERQRRERERDIKRERKKREGGWEEDGQKKRDRKGEHRGRTKIRKPVIAVSIRLKLDSVNDILCHF